MNRRGFIKTVGALAALAAVPTGAAAGLRALTLDERERFLAMARTGLIENQTFVLEGPVVLDFRRHLIIRNCLFYVRTKGNDQAMLVVRRSRKLAIYDCRFEARV